MTNLEEGRGSSNILSEIGSSTPRQGSSATIESSRSKRSTTKTEIIKRDERSAHSRKRKGKVGDAHMTKEHLPSSKKVPRRRGSVTASQQEQASGIDGEKRDLQEPKRKRTREAICTGESQPRTLTKPRKLTKAKSRCSLQLANITEDKVGHEQIKENVTLEEGSSTKRSENDKSKFQSEELVHSNKSSKLILLSSQHVKSKAKKKARRQSPDKAVEKTWTGKIRLRDKARAGKPAGTTIKKFDHTSLLRVEKPKAANLQSGSHGLHSFRKPTLSREVIKRLSDNNVRVLETPEDKEQPRCVEPGSGNLGVKVGDTTPRIRSKETATALKVAHETSGFVRMALKSVEDSKNANPKLKEATIAKTRKEDVSIVDDKPNTILRKVATRYKSTLESLGSKSTMSAEKMIEELGAIRLASKRNVTKTGKLGKKHVSRYTRPSMTKDLEEEPIGRDIVKENAEGISKDRQPNAKPIRLGRKTRKNLENQMRKFGLIDKTPQRQKQEYIKKETSASTPRAKKSNSPVVSGFDRLISGAGGNKEFESALAQIVSSHDDELGWTKDQEKALQNAYLSIKETDGCVWQLISKEVPGRSAKECYNKFYSRHPTPSIPAEAQAAVALHPDEIEYSGSRSDSPQTRSQGISPKATRKQKQLEAQKTIRNILGHVDDIEGYKTMSATVESTHLDTEQDMQSVLGREEEEKAVILQSNPFKDYDRTPVPSHLERGSHNDPSYSFFENVVVSGVSTSSDKENNQPRNEAHNKKSGVARVELILKQVDHGENLPDNSRHKVGNNSSRKKKIIKTNNNVYLHSKDALDFGDTTLDAIQRAKQELRNVFSRTGSRGGRFSDIEVEHIGE